MPSAVFRIDQSRPGLSSGTSGVARKDLWKGWHIQVESTDPPAGASYFWTFEAKPDGSTAEFLDPTTLLADDTVPNPKFMPDKWGPYRVMNTISDGLFVATKVLHVSHDYDGNILMNGFRAPAPGESAAEVNWDLGGGQFNERGYDPDLLKRMTSASIPIVNGAFENSTTAPFFIGASYLDITRVPHEPGMTVTFEVIAWIENVASTTHVDLYDADGIFNSGTPSVVSGSEVTTQSNYGVRLTADLTSLFTGAWDGSGVLATRLWSTPGGHIAYCGMARLIIDGLS
jgi:hypothetical protein